MTVSPLKENTLIPDRTFPINVFFVSSFPLHWHDHMEWIFVRSGKARIQIDAGYEQLQQGELAFVNSKQLHGATGLEPDTQLICVVFNEALVRGSGMDITEHQYFLPYLTQRMKWPSMMKKTDPFMEQINESFERLLTEFERKAPGYELLVKAELLRVFGLFFRYAKQYATQSVNQPAARIRKGHDLSSLLHVLRERYADSFTVSEAARMVNVSPNHFCRVFKQVTGKTLIEYLHLLRINEAERLLLETDLPVTEIAGSVGFSNMTYFGRIFKKMKAVTPSEIRKNG